MSNKGLEPDQRPLNDHERKLVIWLIQHGSYANQTDFVAQLDTLTVHQRCSCGCLTVYFALNGTPVPRKGECIMSDYLANVEGQEVGVMVSEKDGRLSSLEVYSCAGTDQPFGLPIIETLRAF